ncbi:MAG: hypothetical protein ACR2JH_04525 [Solirubrobacteraceae bacterium]
MFDEHLDRQHRLTYFARGPEWAFAIPQGDLDALEDVMRRCSTFWNGVGSLLMPVRADGRIPPTIKGLLGIRPVDACYMHESLGEKARAAAQQLAGAVPLWDGFDRHELHPLNLLGAEERPPEDVMEPPRFRSAALRRVALAVWGYVQDEDAAHWAERYQVVEREGEDAHGALLRGQIEGQSISPLRMTARYMHVVRQVNPMDRGYVCVIGRPSFDALVNFWNFRARSLARAHGAPVIGLPREALGHPKQLGALTRWLFRHPSMRLTPDMLVACPFDLLDETRAALAAVPFSEATGDRIREQVGVGFMPNDPPTFLFSRATVGGPLIRGIATNALVPFANGRSSLALPAPESFKARTLSHTRLVFRNLPLPLPVTPSVANAVHRDAQASDGVMMLTTATEQWNLDIRLPAAGEALAAWVGDHGFAFERSQDGHDADALLARLGSLDALEVLADQKRVAVLDALTPRNRDKLAAALVSEARAEAGVELDAEALVERLSDLGLFLEVETRTAGDIASTIGTGTRKRDVLERLPTLVEAGFVRRAREVRCRRCRFRMYLDLSQLDERVRCRACGEDVVLPVVDESGAKEPDAFYRLDGLMARIMDQDILPVLLTLRATRPPAGSTELFFAWPGVEVSRGDRPKFDIDLVVSHGTTVDGTSNVWCIEVKKTATSIGERQLRRLLEVAAELEARPGIAAMQGEFPEEFARSVLGAGGQVLTAKQLFAGTAPGHNCCRSRGGHVVACCLM